jgi:leucyl-tRNA synthetase
LVLEEVIERMSKSRGNVISPDQVIDEFGADSLRLYEMFMGPLEKEAPWSPHGIQGVYRFLHRVYRLFLDDQDRLRPLAEGEGTPAQARLTARTCQGVTQDFEALRFNTAISKLMVWVRDIASDAPLPREGGEAFVLLLAPLAPHLAEELWEKLGHPETLAYQPWPGFDAELAREETLTMVVQVNGKVRDRIQVTAEIQEQEAIELALASPRVQVHLGGRAPTRVVARPPNLVNVVSE